MDWRDVKGVEGLYKVSDTGKIYSYYSNKVLMEKKDKLGYCRVNLYKDKVQYSKTVHKLVALAFIPNPKKLPIINHKDENPSNNTVSNLEWCTYSYNTSYGSARERRVAHTDYVARTKVTNYTECARKRMKPVLQVKDGKVIKRWDSAKSAILALSKCGKANICEACKGKRKTVLGYEWRYEEEFLNGQYETV